MNIEPIHITRTTIALRPDQSRVLIRPFNPGDEQRTEGIVARILSLPEAAVLPLLNEVPVNSHTGIKTSVMFFTIGSSRSGICCRSMGDYPSPENY